MGPKWTRTRRSTLWLAIFGLVAGWIITIGVLILTAPPPGAASPAELVDQASAPLASGDAEAFGTLLAPPLDQEFPTAYLSAPGSRRTRRRRHTRTAGHRRSAGPVRHRAVCLRSGGGIAGRAWFLSALPPV
jgi:hypothetical protein